MYAKHGKPNVPLYRLTPSASDKFDFTNSPRKKQKKASHVVANLELALQARASLFDWNSEVLPDNIEYLLSESAIRSTFLCQGWSWGDNSCHLDAWLMMELAAYADIIKKRAAASDSGSAVPLVQPGDTSTPALLRLLLNVATDAAEVQKRSFWLPGS